MKKFIPSENVFNFVPVVRASKRPPEALDALRKAGMKDVSLENRLEVFASGDEMQINLLGSVGSSYWDENGITEKEVRDALNEIPKGKPITITVNSEGGSVKEGLGIYDAIKERNKDIKVRIAGYALSIASVFPLAAKKSLGGRGVVSPISAIWMQHKAWSWVKGNADEMRSAADMMDVHDETLVDVYASATGKSADDIRAIMKKETWTKGSAAIDAGLADESDESDAKASYRPLHEDYISRCKNISNEILNALTTSAPKQAVEPKNKKEPTVNKEQKIALLKSWGVSASAELTDEQLDDLIEKGKPQAKKEPAITIANPTAADIAAIQAKLDKAERRRVEDRVRQYVLDQKITNAEIPIYVSAMLIDEEGTAKILDAKEAAFIGGDPVGFSGIDAGLIGGARDIQGRNVSPILENIYKAHTEPNARYAALRDEWPRAIADSISRDRKKFGDGVQAANTFSATITTNFLMAGVIVKLGPKLAALNVFTRDNQQDPYKPLAAGIQKFNTTAQDGSGAETGVTNWEGSGGNSTIDPITITPAQVTERGHITNAELNSGFRMSDLVENKLRDFASKIIQLATAPITVANFTTNAALTRAPGAFTWGDMQTIWGTLKKTNSKNALLDGEYLAKIINVPTQFQKTGVAPGTAWSEFGWDNIALNTDFSGAGANVRGFACGKDAIGIISGMPLTPPEGIPGNTATVGSAQIPDVQIGIQTWVWFSLATRTMWFSYEIIFGASLVDETQGMLIKSA